MQTLSRKLRDNFPCGIDVKYAFLDHNCKEPPINWCMVELQKVRSLKVSIVPQLFKAGPSSTIIIDECINALNAASANKAVA
jgi:hypothetical protein